MDEMTAARGEAAREDRWAHFAEVGDVLGLLAWIRERSVLRIPPDAMDFLARAIRRKQADVEALTDAAYAETVGFTTLFLLRCTLHVERRLAESDTHGGDPTHMPPDLVDEGWMGRVERIARFLMEVTSARARIHHLRHLNDEREHDNPRRRRPRAAPTVTIDRGQAAPGKTPSTNGRVCSPAGRITLP